MSCLRINRTGRVKTKTSSSNQCKATGHREYDYHVCIVVPSTNLDKNKFIIDHVKIHEIVEKEFKNISSCEEIALRIAKRIKQKLPKNNIQIMDLYILIRPVVPGKAPAWMEYSETGDFLK